MRTYATLLSVLLLTQCKGAQTDAVANVLVARSINAPRIAAVRLQVRETASGASAEAKEFVSACAALDASGNAKFDVRRERWNAPLASALAYEDASCTRVRPAENSSEEKPLAFGGAELTLTVGPNASQPDSDNDGYSGDAPDAKNKDCDDGDATTFPGANEDCTKTLDKNCNGQAGCNDAQCQTAVGGGVLPKCIEGFESRCVIGDAGWICQSEQEKCDDRVDNNGKDGIDCEDPLCQIGARCNDDKACTRNDTCKRVGDDKFCVGETNPCGPGTSECRSTTGDCFEADGGGYECKYAPLPAATSCKPQACFTAASCDGDGGCVQKNACDTAAAGNCRVGQCLADGGCGTAPADDFSSCDSAAIAQKACYAGECFGSIGSNATSNIYPANSDYKGTVDFVVPSGCTLKVVTSDGGAVLNPGANCGNQFGVAVPTGQPETVAAYAADSITIAGTLRVDGAQALALLARKRVVVESTGVIDVSADRSIKGAGSGLNAACGAVATGEKASGAASGGPGGSFFSEGGASGDAKSEGTTAKGQASPKKTFREIKFGAFTGGCPGGGGGGLAPPMSPGFGGGAVHLYSLTSVLIDGKIIAMGAGGLGGSTSSTYGGGGGGSGGAILIEAGIVKFGPSARLNAVGGGGGAGANGMNGTGSRSDGSSGQPAAGGMTTTSNSSAGGAGAGTAPNGTVIQAMDSASVSMSTNGVTTGGGGGGLGIIQVNANKCVLTNGAVVAPKINTVVAQCQ
jgi:hypothetical protein